MPRRRRQERPHKRSRRQGRQHKIELEGASPQGVLPLSVKNCIVRWPNQPAGHGIAAHEQWETAFFSRSARPFRTHEKARKDIDMNCSRTNTQHWSTIATSVIAIFILMSGAGLFAQSATQTGKVLRGNAAFGDWREDAPGIRRLITIADLPGIGPEVTNLVELAPKPAGATPHVPDGFQVEVVASKLAQARVIHLAPNGDLFVSNSSAGEVRVYRVPSGSAIPTETEIFASGLHQPYGMAFYPPGPNPQWLYVANSNGVVRFPYKNGDLKTTGKAQQIVDCIPPTHHWTRDILFTPDGKRLLLTVASGSNIALDMFPVPRVPGDLDGWNKTHPLGSAWDTEEGRANILSFNP